VQISGTKVLADILTIDEIVLRRSNPKVERLITEVYGRDVDTGIISTLGLGADPKLETALGAPGSP
jgi:hypothetical protein